MTVLTAESRIPRCCLGDLVASCAVQITDGGRRERGRGEVATERSWCATSAVQEPAETIPVQDSQSAQRELASIQQQLSHTQEKLADARQELIGVRSRQKSLVSELSLTVSLRT